MTRLKSFCLHILLISLGWICSTAPGAAQSAPAKSLPLIDLSDFRNPGKSWQVAGKVRADLNKTNLLQVEKGTGILVNNLGKKGKGTDLLTNLEHGDLDLELDYLLAKGANSGIYLQGQYELQLEDNWNTQTSSAGNNGGIAERLNNTNPKDQKGFGAHAPRQQVSRAPGLWQHLKVSFQAPRFDTNGNKTENAKILYVQLNGVTIHENVELLGPTRGAISNKEVSQGPLRLQGDQGTIAFRNIQIINFDKPRPELTNLHYSVYKGRFSSGPDFTKIKPETEGPAKVLSANISLIPNEFLIRYTGTIRIKEPGEYVINLHPQGGGGIAKINNKVAIPWGASNGNITLAAGDLPFELLYAKTEGWVRPGFSLALSGPGIRQYTISETNTNGGDQPDPILIHAPATTLTRSFMDIPNGKRITHAVSVGSPGQVHYTYDTHSGMLVQVWRGDYLDATPMWLDRGDGSSRPLGSVQRFGNPTLTLAKLHSTQANWVSDTTGSHFRPKGYVLDKSNRPIFKYKVNGASVSDAIRALENGQGVQRELTIENPLTNLYALLAQGSTIEETAKGLYLIDGQSYYLQLQDNGGAKPVIRNINGRQELIIPVRSKLSYAILF